MQAIITPEDTLLHKPNPDPLLEALVQLGHRADETIMVGDSLVDLLAAHNAGTLSAAALWSVVPRKQMLATRPDFLFHKLTELIDIALETQRAQHRMIAHIFKIGPIIIIYIYITLKTV